MTNRNARFMAWINGSAVKITLREGQTLRHYSAHSTDEGWSSEAHEWAFDGSAVYCDWASDGRDCDGRSSAHVETVCPIANLAARMVEYDDASYRFPEWERVSSGQRDYTAEAAGY